MRLFGLFLILTMSLYSYEVIEDLTTLPILAPAYQKSNIKKIYLDNDLKVYLVSDPSAEKSAVALSVNAGSFDDPANHPGLAHFLEHMLFMGTEKYPDEANFSTFIKQYGGRTNAFTEDQYTTYLFELNTDGLPGALDRFSQFFKQPLLKPSGMSREIQAIEQEFLGHSQRDDSRRILVYKELSNPKHPFSKFSSGNRDSLQLTTTNDLKQWFNTHYSSNQMSLVIYSPLNIDKLTELVDKYFSTISNKNRVGADYHIPIFSEQVLGKVIYIEPQKDEPSMMMIWELPQKFAEAINSRPDELICHVLGHEGEKSLLAQLQREGLALELACGGARWGKDAIAFIIKVTLTQKGAERPFSVGTRVFQAIARLKQDDFPKYLFDEIQMIGRMKYQYPRRKEPFDEVKKHSRNIRLESLATYPETTTVIQKYDAQLIHELLETLTPKNLVLDIMAKPSVTKIPPDRNEKWMKTPYAVREIPANVIKEWGEAKANPLINWPAPNVLIPKNLEVVQTNGEPPILLEENEFGKAYWIPDHNYNVPKVSWTFRILTPSIDAGDPKSNVMTDLMIKAVKKQLTHFSYLAKIAELDYNIKQISGGLEITLNGFSENAPMLLHKILSHLTQLEINEETFQLIRKTLENHYGNIKGEEPYLQAIDLFKKVLYERYSTEREKERAIAQLSYQEFQTFMKNFFSQTYHEVLLYGNISRSQAEEILNKLKSFQKEPYTKRSQQKVAILPEIPYYLSQSREVKGNAVLVMIEDPNYSLKNYAAQEILSTMISGPFFDELRTKQQTAYLIANIYEEVEKKFFSILLLQSFNFAPTDLLARIELFLETAPKSLSKEIFETVKKSLVQKLKAPPENLKKQGEQLAQLAFKEGGDFEWKIKAAEKAEALTYEGFIEYVNNFLGKTNKRRLAILIKGQSSDEVFEYHKAGSIHKLKDEIDYRDGIQ